MTKTMREIKKKLGRDGYALLDYQQSKHFKVLIQRVSDGARHSFILAVTATDNRAVKNFIGDVRRHFNRVGN